MSRRPAAHNLKSWQLLYAGKPLCPHKAFSRWKHMQRFGLISTWRGCALTALASGTDSLSSFPHQLK